MSTQNRGRLRKKDKIGFCLNCGSRLSFCGYPFTADLKCPKCGAVNAYVASYQPVSLKAKVELAEATIAA